MKRTHKGLMYGIVPVYLDFTERECPGVEARHWSLEWLLDVVEAMFGLFCMVATTINPTLDPQFPIKITGVLDWDGEEIGG